MAEAKKSYAKMTKEEEQFAKTLGLKITQAREALSMSQEELGRQAKLNQTTISLIENGRRIPNIKTIIKLSKVLQKNLSITLE